jgi:hypothetical protein
LQAEDEFTISALRWLAWLAQPPTIDAVPMDSAARIAVIVDRVAIALRSITVKRRRIRFVYALIT